jgi:hypothetical protein
MIGNLGAESKGIYSFVNRTIELWNQLSASRTHFSKPSNFRKRVRKVINEAK